MIINLWQNKKAEVFILLWFFFGSFLGHRALAQLQWENRLLEFHPSLDETNVVARYTFKNIGTQPVAITSMKGSCGACVAVTSSQKSIAPDKKGNISVNFVYGQSQGLQERTILIQSNAPKDPMAVLTLRVHVPELVKITPPVVMWFPSRRQVEEIKAKILDFKVVQNTPIKVLKVQSNNPKISVKFKEKKTGNEYEIEVVPSDLGQSLTAIIQIQALCPSKKMRTFYAYAMVRPSGPLGPP